MKQLSLNRRKFFKNIFFTIFSLQILYFFGRLLKTNTKEIDEENYHNVGELSYFQKGQVYPFGTENMYLHRLTNGGFLAISSKCTHLGCTIQFDVNRNRFECPCHASAFDNKGMVLSPPAVRALDYYPMVIKNNKVFVDIHNPVKRNNFEASQVTFA